MISRAVLDISGLPKAVEDHRSPIWWGNLLLLVVETVMFGLLVTAYFYFRQNFNQWPPPRVNETPILFNPQPKLDASSINMMLLFLSCLPMAWLDGYCLRKGERASARLVQIALAVLIVLGFIIAGLRFQEFFDLQFRWNENAYASIVWTILGMHLLHIVTGTLENVLMLTWVLVKPLDIKHARDIRVTAVYWYWIAGIWVPLYIIVFWGPRWI
jgi:cytochrome c oxidase subunit 3